MANTISKVYQSGIYQAVGDFDEVTLESGSVYLSSTNGYLTVPYSNTNFAWSSTDFTIEAWVNPTVLTTWYSGSPTIPLMVGNMDPASGTNYWSFGPADSGYLKFYYYNGTPTYVSSSSSGLISQNTWTHIAMTKTSSGISLFVNGSRVLTNQAVSGTPQYGPTTAFTIGKYNNNNINGYISNLRIIKGTALYTSDFTPSKTILTNVANTVLLIDNSTSSIVDSSPNRLTVTNSSSVAYSGYNPFAANTSTGSLSFSNSKLTTAYDSRMDLTTGDFTVEGWFYLTSVPGTMAPMITSFNGNAAGLTDLQYWIGVAAGGSTQMQMAVYSGSTAYRVYANNAPINTWNHFALVRNGTSVDGYLNGKKNNSFTVSGALNTSNWSTHIGGYTESSVNYYFPGNLTDIRITKGTALYTANFAVPTMALTSTANTSLLLNAATPTTYLTNTSNSSTTLTATGTVSWNIGAPNLYSPTAGKTVFNSNTSLGSVMSQNDYDEMSLNAVSMSFNGSTQYLSLPASTNYAFGTGDFTIDFWIYFTNTTTGSRVATNRYTGGGATGTWSVSMSNTSIAFTEVVVGEPGPSATIADIKNKWTHIAITRTSSLTRIFVNGVEVASATQTTNFNNSSYNLWIATSPSENYIPGLLSNLRIIKGTSLYTGNFTPPRRISPLVPNTVLLIDNSTTTIQDSSPYKATITNTGSVTANTYSPFIQNQPKPAKRDAQYGTLVSGYIDDYTYDPNAYDASFANTVLLLKTTGTNAGNNNIFLSSAPTGVGSYSGYFSGNSQYLSTPNIAALQLGAGDFTAEAWIYPTRLTNTYLSAICGTYGFISSADKGWAIYLNSTGYLTLSMFGSAGAGFTLTSSIITPINSWSHVAAVRSGTTVTLYLNGVQVATGTSSKNEDYSIVDFNIATVRADTLTPATGNSGQSFQGYISNVRVVKGVAVYTSSFTPPTSPLAAIGGTSILTCQNSTFIDNGPNAVTITNNGSASIVSPNTTVTFTRSGTPTQGSFSPYDPVGYWSNYFGGTDYLKLGSNVLPDISGPFTLEFWVNPKSGSLTTNRHIFGTWSNNTAGWGLFINKAAWNGTYIFWYFGNYGSNECARGVTSDLIEYDKWNHIAVSRDSSNTWYFFVNGVSRTTTTYASGTSWIDSRTFDDNTNSAGIGSANYQPGTSLISNLRLVVGSSVYTTDFTPPTYPLTAIANTYLLTCQSNTFKDNSANNLAITVNGTPTIQDFNPFNIRSLYSPSTTGGSQYNVIKTGYVTMPNSNSVAVLSGDFTLEAWVYPTDTSITDGWGIIDARTNGQTATPWLFYLGSYASGGWKVAFYNAGYNYSAGLVYPNRWTHVVVQRNGSTLRYFINGVVDSNTVTINGAITGGTGTITIGNTKDNGLSAYGCVGYTSDIRVVNGTAVYNTSGFTPPTSPATWVANTSLLMNYTNASIYDATDTNNLLTVSNSQVNTSVVKYNTGSIKFNGSSDYISFLQNPVNDLSSSSFTIEGWAYSTTTASAGHIVQIGGNSSAYAAVRFYFDTGGAFVLLMSTSGSAHTVNSGAIGSYLANTWYHFAIVRDGTSIKVYINGTSIYSTTLSGALMSGTYNLIGATYSSPNYLLYLNGYVEDLRVTKSARYTSDFITPKAPLPISNWFPI